MNGTTAESVARGLDRATGSGGQWMACCPAHEDSNPSLSLTDDGDKVLVHCHAGCSQEAVIEELKGRGLWHEGRNGSVSVPVPKPIRGNGNGNAKGERCTYSYYRSDGVLHVDVHVLRDPVTGKKAGRPWRSPKGVADPHPLYRAREIAERFDSPVLVVEGERTVEVAEQHFHDYVVTTNLGGGNSAGTADWTPLKGRTVVIWPDADEAGAKHAEKVSKLVTEAGASDVRIVELPPGLPDKWDLADPVPEGVDVRAILEARAELKSIRLDELLAMPDPMIEWAVDDMLPAMGSSVAGGGKGVGKSVLVRTLAAAKVDGRPWLNRGTTPGTVLYIAHEDGVRTVKRHFQALDVKRADRLHVVFEREPTGRERFRRLCGSVEVIKPSLVIVDTMFRFVDIPDGNEYAPTVAALSPYVDLARAKGFHILFTHHSRKSGGEHGTELLGSVGLTALADTVISLKVENEQRVVYGFGRDGVELEKTIVRLDDAGRAQAIETKRAADTRAVGQRILEFVESQSEPVTKAQIRDGVGGRAAVVVAALRDLVADGDLEINGTGKRSDPVNYSIPDSHL